MLCAQIDLMDKEAPNQLQQSRSRKAQPSGGDGGGCRRRVSKQQPAVACTFSYWLSLYLEPLCACQIPDSNLLAERGPLSCLRVSISPSCLETLLLMWTHQPTKEVRVCFAFENGITPVCLYCGVRHSFLNGLEIMEVLSWSVCVAHEMWVT